MVIEMLVMMMMMMRVCSMLRSVLVLSEGQAAQKAAPALKRALSLAYFGTGCQSATLSQKRASPKQKFNCRAISFQVEAEVASTPTYVSSLAVTFGGGAPKRITIYKYEDVVHYYSRVKDFL